MPVRSESRGPEAADLASLMRQRLVGTSPK